MQNVSVKFLNVLRSQTKSLAIVVEFYHQDATPSANGFDPQSLRFLLGVASGEWFFRGREYRRLVAKGGIGRISKTINKQLSGTSVTLSNSTREVIDFENETGFDGLVYVARLVDLETSTELADSAILFVGRCSSPDEFTKASETAKINVKQILNQVETLIPRATFGKNDSQGRAQSDPEFEGILYTPRGGSNSYTEKVQKGGLLGSLLGLKKTVTRTQAYSSHSDLKEETRRPVVLGRTQMELLTFAYIDRGTWIEFTGFWADGHEYGIENVVSPHSVTDGLNLAIAATKMGRKGGLVDDANTQANDDPNWFMAAIFSRLAYSRCVATGSTVQQQDPAPTVAAIVLGQKLPVPDASGSWSNVAFSDSAVAHSRWLLSSSYYFNLPAEWHDDTENFEAFSYGDHILVDRENTDTVLLPASETNFAGSSYRLYTSTALVKPNFFKYRMGQAAAVEAFLNEADYQFYDDPPYNSDDPTGIGVPALPPTKFRRRYTSNLVLLEQMKAIDFLFDILLSSANLYLVQKANGKIAHRHKKPEPFAFFDAASAIGANQILVKNVNPWIGKPGKILIGANLGNSEVRDVTNAFYKTDLTIAFAASGGVSASGSTLTGTPLSGTLTVSNASGAKSLTIGGVTLTYNPQVGETTQTCAAMLAAAINSHEELNKWAKAVWQGNNQTVVSSRIGYLSLNAGLEFAHLAPIASPVSAPSLSAASGGNLAAGAYQVSYSFVTLEGETRPSPFASISLSTNQKINIAQIAFPARVLAIRYYVSVEPNGVRRKLLAEISTAGAGTINTLPKADAPGEAAFNMSGEEIHRIALAFVDKANTRADLSKSNVLKGTFTFPQGGREPKYNQVEIPFRDAAADYQLTTITVNDYPNQAKVKKPVILKIDGAAIDNEHQVRRIANQRLAEALDGGKFYGLSSDNEALLLEEGDVICVTDESGRLVNEPARIEDVDIDGGDGYPSVSFVGRKYRRYYYSDQIQDRVVPLPLVQNAAVNREQLAPVIYQKGTAENAKIVVGVTGYSVEPNFRKTQICNASNFQGATLREIVQTADLEVGKILPGEVEITRSTNLSSAETVYVRTKHSTNKGSTYGYYTAPLAVTFPAAGGTGGGGGTPTITPASLGVLSFDGNHTVSGSITNNGGGGTIHIFRKFGSESYAEVQSGTVAQLTASGLIGSVEADGTYTYKLTQDGVAGESAERSITVDVPEPPAPTAQTPVLDSVSVTGSGSPVTVTLAWTLRDGTGDINIYYNTPTSTGNYVKTVAAGASPDQHTAARSSSAETRYYYLDQAGVSGQSNQIETQIPATLQKPDDLTASTEGFIPVLLAWINYGSTGNKNIERRRGTSGGWSLVATAGASDTIAEDTVPIIQKGIHYYRIYDDTMPGEYSYSDGIFIYK